VVCFRLKGNYVERQRYGYCADDVATISDLIVCYAADQSLSKRVLTNELYVLQPLLPDKTNFTYNLRSRYHNRQLMTKTTQMSC